MKYRIFTIGLVAALFTACSVNEMDINTPSGENEEFFAIIEDTSLRVYVDDDLMVLWHADDRVSIFNKYTYNQEYRFTGETGANSGSFKKVPNDDFITGNALNYVYAVYPFQESTAISNQGVLSINLPATQAYAENSFGIGANTMVSCSEGNELLFKNLCGYLMLKLYGDDVSVKSISLKGNNNESLAGLATVNASVNAVPSLSFGTSATREITLTFDTPVTLGTTAETATVFWLVVPPTTFSKGFTLTVKDNKNGEFEKSTTKSFQISRNTLSRMSALEVEIDSSNNIISFADEKIKARLVAAFDTNGDNELSFKEAAAVTSIEGVFGSIKTYSSFDEFQFFTGVKSIPADMFNGWERLTSIKIPESVSFIGDRAFNGCTLLTTVNIPNSLSQLNYRVFAFCSSLQKIEFPESITVIHDEAFGSCSSLTSIILPKNLIEIGSYAFSGCNVSSIHIPSLVRSIGQSPFSLERVESITVDPLNTYFDSRDNCNALIETKTNTLLVGCQNTIIPQSIKNIGTLAFSDCVGLRIIDIPSGIMEIPGYAFKGCLNLASITIPSTVISISDSAFQGCKSLKSVELPMGLENLGNSVFFGCSSLTKMVIPAGITSIGWSVFRDCSNLAEIALPEKITSIGEQSFYNCTSLVSISFPETIYFIGYNALNNCVGLTSITVKALIPPSGAGAMFYNTSCPIYVPAESVDAYKSAQYWSYYASRIQAIPTLKDFAQEFVKGLDVWESTVGTVESEGSHLIAKGTAWENVHFIPIVPNPNCEYLSHEGNQYDPKYTPWVLNVAGQQISSSQAWEIAIRGLMNMVTKEGEAFLLTMDDRNKPYTLQDNGSLMDAIPNPSIDNKWGKHPWYEGSDSDRIKYNGAEIETVDVNFMVKVGAWHVVRAFVKTAGNSSPLGMVGNVQEFGTTSGSLNLEGYAGYISPMRELLILMRIYKYILDNNIDSNVYTAIKDQKFDFDLYGIPFVPVPEAIDLGLSVKWASFNLGASKPEEYGDYYAWGETDAKLNYSPNSYKWGRTEPDSGGDGVVLFLTKYNTEDNKTSLDSEDDAAHIVLGGRWRMPTISEVYELVDNCTQEWTTEKGIKGARYTSTKQGYTDKSIFLPAAGFRSGDSLIKEQSVGRYWTSSLDTSNIYSAFFLQFGPGSNMNIDRIYGQSIRPVFAE